MRSGNKVSEFGNTSKRTFKPNVVISQFYSELLGEKVKMRVTTRVQKTIHKQGGLDNFMLLSQEKDHICESALALRQRIEAAFLQKGVANLAVKDPKANAGLEGAHCVEGASPKTPSAVAEADDLADLVPTISIPLRSLEVRAAP